MRRAGYAALLPILLAPALAAAQRDAPPEPALPEKPSSYYSTVVRAHRPSPSWTQDRSFTSTRFWLLDPGSFEVETWFRTRIYPVVNGVRAPAELLMQHEIEIGVWPHLQIDLYENMTFNVEDDGVRRAQQEGNQIEARIAIPSYYGQMFANPVVYLEWHPRHGEPDRAELRLLLGGAPKKWLYLAVNPYVETNVESTDVYSVSTNPLGGVVHTTRFIADMEFGTTVAAGFRINDRLRLSAELKIGADMLGDEDNKLHFVWWLGPGFILKPLPPKYRQYLKIMATCLFAMPGTPSDAQQFEPLVSLGSQC
jgi:tellurite resistance-related uncharacterized protein